MRVKCKICGNKKEREDMFNMRIDGKNNYYCNQEEYMKMIDDRDNRYKVTDICFDIIGKTTNTALYKELTEIAEVHTYKKLRDYLEYDKSHLIRSTEKAFSNEYSKIRYFMTIIKNRIGDFKVVVESSTQKTQVLDLDIGEVKHTKKTRKKGLSEFIAEEE